MLSVVIPISGTDSVRANNFRAALNCTQQQTFKDFELIIVEQYMGVQPAWKKEVEPLCDKYIPITENTLPDWGRFSLSWCKNVGARAAKYDTLVLLDADIVYGDDYFARIAEVFNPATGYLMGYEWVVWLSYIGANAYLSDGVYRTKWKKGYTWKRTYPGWTGGAGGGGSIIFDKGYFFDVIGGYNENYSGWGKEDKDILWRAHWSLGMTHLDRVPRLDYILLHLQHRRTMYNNKAVDTHIPYFGYTRPYPRRVNYLIVEAQVGKSECVSRIDLSRLDPPSAGYLDLTRLPLTREERIGMMARRNNKYSFEDFTNQKFFDATDLNGSVVIGSCFYQDAKGRNGDPRVGVFPSDMVGVTFIECNLDNVYIPSGNMVDPLCYCRRVKRQYDGELWILNEDLDPVELLHKDRLLKLGINVSPKKIPKSPLPKEKMAQRRRDRMKKIRELNMTRGGMSQDEVPINT